MAEKEVKLDDKKTGNNKALRVKIVSVISVITIIVAYIVIRGSYLETLQVGSEYVATFNKKLLLYAITFMANFVILFLSFYLTNKAIKKGLQSVFDYEKKEMPNFPNKSISFIIALITSLSTTSLLLNGILLCFSNSHFGINDPIFNLDISFFVFILPLIKIMLIYLILIIIGTLVYAMMYSIIILNKSLDGVSRESLKKVDLVNKISKRVKTLAFLFGLFVVAFLIFNIGNERFLNIELNDGTQYFLMGAGFADITFKLVGYVILAILVVVTLLKAFNGIKTGSIKKTVKNLVIVPVYLIVLAILLAFYQLIFVGSKIDKNQKYIADNINYTKQAYGLTTEEINKKYSGTITESELNENTELLSNIPIVNNKNVLQDLTASKSAKSNYLYRNTQIGNYKINGEDTLVYVTPREISTSNMSYINKTYQYTHGYGVVVTYAGITDDYGNLISGQKDVEDVNSLINITEPRIYFGMETNNPIVINSEYKEIDYTIDDTGKEKEYEYNGSAGLKLNFLDRLILGIREGNLRLAFLSEANENTKIITNRNIINRAKSVMPYLKYEDDPYLVIDDSGKMFWVLDAYTTSNNYPFSQRTEIGTNQEINYIRNSVKVIINAFDGTTKFYITDRTDPIVMAYNNMYPDLFAKADEKIPEDISKHFIYPQYLFKMQSKIEEIYHNITPEVLFRGNDVWEMAETVENNKSMEPYYIMIREDNNLEIGLVMPYTMYGKQNIISYMVGTYDNSEQKLKVYKFPSDSNVLGISQLETQISQDDTIATDIASLNVTGTKLYRNLIAIPINDTMVYVENIYQHLINETSQKPTLKKVIVASGNKIAIGNDLKQALKNLLSQYAVDIDLSDSNNLDDLINSIVRANDNLNNSSRNGDWKLYGEDLQELTSLINQLKALKQSTNTEDDNTTDAVNETVSNIEGEN